MSTPIKRFTKFFPATLARIQSGTKVNLRDKLVKKKGPFDLLTKNSTVEPIPPTQKQWTHPNGCSLRSPYSTTFHDIADSFGDTDVDIFIIEEGTSIPADLVLLYERGDHFSFQCSRPMPLTDLNTKLTDFLARNATHMSKDAYEDAFPAGKDNDRLDVKSLKEN